MALDLADLKRLKITPETRAWLTAEARATRKTFAEVARDALHEIALKKIHEAKVLTGLVASEDLGGDSGGRQR